MPHAGAGCAAGFRKQQNQAQHVVGREAASLDVHLDALEHAARDLREYSAAAPKSELYQDLARCIGGLVTWLRLRADSACKTCSGSDTQEGVCVGAQVQRGSLFADGQHARVTLQRLP